MKAITILMLFVLGAFAVLGYVVKALVTYQEQVKTLQTQVQHLEADLKSAQEKATGLEQSLATIQSERDQAGAERDAWQARAQQMEQALGEAKAENERLQARVQELEQALQLSQPQGTNGVALGTQFQLQGFLAILSPALLIVLAIVGYAELRLAGKSERLPYVSAHASQTDSQSRTVVIRIPRQWMPKYIQWLRRVQLEEDERS